jgi:hypothetical protein
MLKLLLGNETVIVVLKSKDVDADGNRRWVHHPPLILNTIDEFDVFDYCVCLYTLPF